MQTYCLICRKYTDNIGPRKVIITNKVVREKSRCANCMSDKSKFLQQKSNNKRSWNNISILNYWCINHYKTWWHIV